MSWPTRQDFFEAIQNPKLALLDPELKNGQIKVTPSGLPWGFSGAFAIVYLVNCGNRNWAVKCFLQDFKDNHQRYLAISSHLAAAKLPYTVGFEFQPQGIRVRGKSYPILKMEWSPGERLDSYIQKHRTNTTILSDLSEKWLLMMATLRQHGIAHGDLQHGNIMVVNGDFKLIDYDGMFVPALQNLKSHEIGHQNYQHPKRTEKDFGVFTDNFSAWVIHLSFLALRHDHNLWANLKEAGDNRLIFSKDDFENPEFSPILRSLQNSSDQKVHLWVNEFKKYCRQDVLDAIPPVSEFEPPPPPSADWIKDHKKSGPKDQAELPVQNRPQLENTDDSFDWIASQRPALEFKRFSTDFKSERLIVGVQFIVFCAQFLIFIFAAPPISNTVVGVLFANTFFILWIWSKFTKLPEHQFKAAALKAINRAERHSFRMKTELEATKKILNDFALEENEAFDLLRSRYLAQIQNEKKELSELNNHIATEQTAMSLELKRAIANLSDNIAVLQDQLQKCQSEEKNELDAHLAGIQSSLKIIQKNKMNSNSSELDELSKIIAALQKTFIEEELRNARLEDHKIRGIGSVMLERLQSAGYYTAADLPDYWQNVQVNGIGYFKAIALLDWKMEIISDARREAPKILDEATKLAIIQKWNAYRASLDKQEADLKRMSEEKLKFIKANYQQRKTHLINNIATVQDGLSIQNSLLNKKTLEFQDLGQKRRLAVGSKWQKSKIEIESQSQALQATMRTKREELAKKIVEQADLSKAALHDKRSKEMEFDSYRFIRFDYFVKTILFGKISNN